MLSEMINTWDNLEYGILIAIVIVGILLLGLSVLDSKRKLSPLSYIIALILLIPLSYQMSRLVGACCISDTSSTITDIVGVFSEELSDSISSITTRSVGWFIFRRIIWSLAFVVFFGVGMYATMQSNSTMRNSRNDRVSSRHSRTGNRNHRYE